MLNDILDWERNRKKAGWKSRSPLGCQQKCSKTAQIEEKVAGKNPDRINCRDNGQINSQLRASDWKSVNRRIGINGYDRGCAWTRRDQASIWKRNNNIKIKTLAWV